MRFRFRLRAPVAAPAAVDDEVARGPVWRREPATDTVADEPLTAERDAAANAEPQLVTGWPAERAGDRDGRLASRGVGSRPSRPLTLTQGSSAPAAFPIVKAG